MFRPEQGLLVVSEGEVKCMNLGKVNWIRDHEKTKTLPLPPPPKPQNIILALGSQKYIQAEMTVQSERNEVVTPRPLTLPCHTCQLVTSTRVLDSSV